MIKASEASQGQIVAVASAMTRLRYSPKPRPRRTRLSAELKLDAERTKPPSGAELQPEGLCSLSPELLAPGG
jgi:hypothetical protein